MKNEKPFTRDRTKAYITFRDAYNSRNYQQVDLEDERQGLLGDERSHDHSQAWMAHVQEARKVIDDMKTTLHTLDRLMSQFFIIDFQEDDDDIKLQGITNISKTIKTQCTAAKQYLIQAKSVQIRHNIRSETTVRQNMISALVRQLEDYSKQFQDKERQFMSRYKSMSAVNPMSDMLESVDPSEDLEVGQSIILSQKVNDMTATINERDREIRKLAHSVEEVAGLFKDLHMLTMEQSTILDQIEINCEATVQNVDAGVVQIKAADQLQRKSRFPRCCILLLIVTIILVIVIGIIFLNVKK